MPLLAILCLRLVPLAPLAGGPLHLRAASFGIPDTLFLVVLALIVFGPKKLPEISRQIGKLLYEFRKASNDFKFQIEEELRSAEQAERQKALTAQAASVQPATPVALAAGEVVSAEPVAEAASSESSATDEVAVPNQESALTIQPPDSGTPVGARSPYRAVEDAAGAPAAKIPPASSGEPRAAEQSRPSHESRPLEELEADAQEAVRAAAADPSYNQTGDAIPTHHG